MYKTLTFSQLHRVVGTTAGRTFRSMIQRMNEMYKLPVNTEPTLYNLTKPNGSSETAVQRITGFLKTLADEVSEGAEIKAKLLIIEYYKKRNVADTDRPSLGAHQLAREAALDSGVSLEDTASLSKIEAFASLALNDLPEAEKDVLVDIGDWTGDIVVYCRSEAMKFGINLESMLEAIMGSNFTKLPSDGIPKHDENGKFLKDMTNFVPPENAIKTLMFGTCVENDAKLEHGSDAEIAARGTSAHPLSAANLLSDKDQPANTTGWPFNTESK